MCILFFLMVFDNSFPERVWEHDDVESDCLSILFEVPARVPPVLEGMVTFDQVQNVRAKVDQLCFDNSKTGSHIGSDEFFERVAVATEVSVRVVEIIVADGWGRL